MAYVNFEQKFWALWMRPAEAAAHVHDADGCTLDQAQQQILQAHKEGEIQTIWQDGYHSPDFKTSYDNYTRRRGTYSVSMKSDCLVVDWNEGTAIYLGMGLINTRTRTPVPGARPRHRPILFFRLDIDKLWPLSKKVIAKKTTQFMTPTQIKREEILAAAKTLKDQGKGPKILGWKLFCAAVRTKLKAENTRGYGEDTIENIVRPIPREKGERPK